jgi:hypothetical protein
MRGTISKRRKRRVLTAQSLPATPFVRNVPHSNKICDCGSCQTTFYSVARPGVHEHRML